MTPRVQGGYTTRLYYQPTGMPGSKPVLLLYRRTRANPLPPRAISGASGRRRSDAATELTNTLGPPPAKMPMITGKAI